MKKYFLTAVLVAYALVQSTAQTCTGSLGDPIVNVSFGSGSNYGPPLAAGTTSSLQYQSSSCPSDGNYSIVNYTSGCWPNDVVWHTATDHTGNNGGYYMLVNASNDPSDFYIQAVDGLCGGTTYQFAAWLLNMCSVSGTLPNITFTIESVNGTILSTYNTGDVPIINPVTWEQYGFYFTTPPGVSKIVLRMRNNSPGGVGNDLGLDDITFRAAGPAIKVTIDGNVTDTLNLCLDDTAGLHFTSIVESCYGATAYQWQVSADNGTNWNNISGATGNDYTRQPTIAGKYLYRLTVAQAENIGIVNCRVASNPISITVNASADAIITGDTSTCSGGSIVLNVSGGNSYNWSGPNGFSSANSRVSILQAAVINSGKYRVIVTGSLGCRAVDSIIVQVYARPQAAFSFTVPACENTDLGFADQSVTGNFQLLKWAWNFGDGNTSNASSPFHAFRNTGSYQVSLYIENDKGCKSDTVKKEVVINPSPKPAFGLPAICLTDLYALFSDSSTIADNSESQFLYRWNFGDPNAGPAAPNTSTQKDPRHTYSAVGIYPVVLSVTGKNGCTKDTLQNFTVNGSQPNAKFTIDSTVNFCSNNDVIIINEASVNFGNLIRTKIYWDYPDSSIQTIDSFPVEGKKYVHRYPEFYGPGTKTVALRYVVFSGIGCVKEVTQPITLKAVPVIRFDSLKAVCENVPPFIVNQAREINGLAGSGIYSGAGINGSNLFNPSTGAGQHLIRYSFSTTGGCTAFAEQPIRVLAGPIADAGSDQTILRGGFVLVGANIGGNGEQYEWTPDTYIDNNHLPTPRVSPVESVIYTLKVTSPDGCVANDQAMINVVNDIYVPSAFSPNGDGLNDTWRIPFMESYTGSSVDVFDRFGQLVYHSTGGSKGWDGKFKGKKLPLSSYAWIIHPGNDRKALHGMVTIVR